MTIKSISELEAEYRASIAAADLYSVDMSKWLPTFGTKLRPLVGGELVAIIGDVGTGKSAVAQNIIHSMRYLTALYFSIELPGSLMFERQVGMAHNASGEDVEKAYRAGDHLDLAALTDLYVCPDSQISTEGIEAHIFDLKERLDISGPHLVIVDYIGLVTGYGKRYERVSNAAEDLKRIAKTTDTVIVLVSQVHRSGDEETQEIFLHSAKDSGSIEASCGLAIGIWRDPEDASALWVKILKSTKGKASAGRIATTKILCNFDRNTLRITERTKHEDGEFDRECDFIKDKQAD